MKKISLNLTLFLLAYFAIHHDVINAMKRSHCQISNAQKNKQLPPVSKKIKLSNKAAAILCALCNKTFSTSSNLSKHKKIHASEKPYSCTFCNKKFTQNEYLTTHEKTHTGKKSYKCDMCNKTFSQQSHRTRHMNTHTGERPYSCNVCDKKFYQNAHLIAHQSTHTGERPYSCNICNITFSQNSSLTKHKKSHTKTITQTINPVKNNTKQMPTQITKDISLKSLNTPTDYQNILENIMSINDADFNDWMKK